MRCYRRPRSGGIAAIGDSVTAGTSAPDWGILGADSWFSHAIAEGRLPYCYNAARGNTTTEMVAERLPSGIVRKPHVVAVLTGTNDVVFRLPLDAPIALLRRMVADLRSAAIVPVLGTLPPYAVAPEGVVEFNARIREVSDSDGVLLIDFHACLSTDDHFTHGLSDDGLHPNVTGSRLMGHTAVPVLQQALV